MAPTSLPSRAAAIATIALVASTAFAPSHPACAAAYSPPQRTPLNAATGVGSSSISTSTSSRRAFLSKTTASVPAVVGAAVALNPRAASAAAATKESLLSDLKASKEKLAPIPELLKSEQWDSVRTLLKTPPVNQLWNLGESQNTLMKLAKETDEFELIELKDELAISLQMCDQYTYDNAFVYFQPGNGKVKLKEPTDMAIKAMKQIQEAIDIVG